MDDEADTNNQRGKSVNQGTIMEICDKVNNTWHRYIKEGKIKAIQFNPNIAGYNDEND